jgi:Flp pilus assembly protein TadD
MATFDRNLSAHDSDVLSQIFGSSTLTTVSASSSSSAQHKPEAGSASDNTELSNCEGTHLADDSEYQSASATTLSVKFELEAVQSAENGDLETAERLFSQAIDAAPGRASVYNNRAQCRRLANNIQGAEDDLQHALLLSAGKGSAACQAFTQRAILHRLKGDEDSAIRDFKMAATLGGQFAKSQLVASNPFAAMSNGVLAELTRVDGPDRNDGTHVDSSR